MAAACLISWVTGVVFGSIPVIFNWVKYDPAEMLCAVFWESSYSDMMTYILCAFSICIFLPVLLMLVCSNFREAGLALLWTRKPRNLESEPVLTAITKTDLSM
ncbi:hypothetical protein GOODEAATRI_015669 [Goodea atripinnis]|uniref:Uncharacterized protein n=1 Tax=Goodea atripinnis TaxID=208336 RepID=A0ABV0N330_9TELE